MHIYSLSHSVIILLEGILAQKIGSSGVWYNSGLITWTQVCAGVLTLCLPSKPVGFLSANLYYLSVFVYDTLLILP